MKDILIQKVLDQNPNVVFDKEMTLSYTLASIANTELKQAFIEECKGWLPQYKGNKYSSTHELIIYIISCWGRSSIEKVVKKESFKNGYYHAWFKDNLFMSFSKNNPSLECLYAKLRQHHGSNEFIKNTIIITKTSSIV